MTVVSAVFEVYEDYAWVGTRPDNSQYHSELFCCFRIFLYIFLF